MTESSHRIPTQPIPKPINNSFSRRFGLSTTGVGLFLFLLGAVPQYFGLDNSEAIGFVQVGVFTIGLLLICLGGSFALNSLWPRYWRSIAADIGLRLAWSGWVMAGVSAMADIIGLGTRPLRTSFTFFGPWQGYGVLLGEGLIFIGFLMMIPFRKEYPIEKPEEEEEVSEEESGETEPQISISIEN
jgi:hypothetical protein